MRFFARVFLLCTLLIYIFIIGSQLIPRDGTFGFVETIFTSARTGISSLKHFFFQDEELVTLDGPGGLQIPIPITVDLTPDLNPFTNIPPSTQPQTQTSPSRTLGRTPSSTTSAPPQHNTSSNTQQNNTNIPPTVSALSLSCAGTRSGNSITWSAVVSGGNTPYRFVWSTDASGSTQNVTNTYTTEGLKTGTITVTDTAGRSAQAQCQATPTISTPSTNILPPSGTIGTQTRCNLDWCAPIAIRPDQRYTSTSSCTPVWSVEEIAQNARVAWFGTGGQEIPSSLVPAPTTQCFGAQSLANYQVFNDQIKSRADALGKTVYRINAFRFDIIGTRGMAQPGFSSSWLVRPATPHQNLLDFYANDTSSQCGGVAGTCRFSYSAGGIAREGTDTGRRLRDFIDASGGTGAYQNVVYYIARSNAGQRDGWAVAVLADMRNSAYRAWRVGQARQIIQDGHFDFIELNHKFHFYKPTNNWQTLPGSWLGGAWAPNVTSLNNSDDTPFSNPPLNYTYADYVSGWSAMGRDLRNAGIPYAVTLNGGAWVNASDWNDPSTPVDEAALIRETAEGAGLVIMDYQSWLGSTRSAQLDQTVASLESRGIIVIKIRSECGYGSGTPTSCTTAELQVNSLNQLAQIPRTNTLEMFAFARLALLMVIAWLLYSWQKRFL